MNSSFLYHAWGLYSLECTKEEYKGNTIILHVQSKKRLSVCPKCAKRHLVKNGYRFRDFIGLPIGGKKVIIRIKVQRYKCKNEECDYDQQEKTFMLQTGPLGEDRLRVCTESSKHGRMFICFVALILASYIRHIRGTKPELTKAFPSMAAILEEMQTIRCIEHDGRRKFITPFVGDQVTICDAFGFEIPEGCRPTYTSRKSTKGRCGRPAKPQTETS